MLCPICNEKLKEEYLDYYNGIVHESLYFCEAKDHEFSESFIFGITETKIGEAILHYNYRQDNMDKYNDEYNFHVWMEKKRLEESKKEDE